MSNLHTPPSSEDELNAVLGEYQVLNSAPESLLDDLARVTAHLLAAPVAFIGFFDGNRVWFKARFGWNIESLPSGVAFCTGTKEGTETLVISDARLDPRFDANPLVTAEPFIRFYAGQPLISPEGVCIGALSVYDRSVRTFTEPQKEALAAMGRQVMAHLNARRQRRTLEQKAEGYDTAVEALQDSDDRFRDLFESVDDLIVSIGADGRLLHVNRGWTETLGYFDPSAAPKTIFEVIHPDSLQEFKKEFDDVLAWGQSRRMEAPLVTEGGRTITVEGTFNPKAIDGRAALVRVILKDISDRKKNELELAKARDAALESARLKSQFLTNVSHEIRTPMHAVVGMLGLLAGSPLTPEQKEYAQIARSSADELLAIINNILQMSKIEAGNLSVTVSDFDLNKTVERLTEVMQIAALDKKLDLKVQIDSTLPPVLRGDVARIRQVLTNLLANAMKFTEQGSVIVDIRKDRETDTHLLVKFAVKDTGVGIPEQAMGSLFQSFSQVDGSTTRKYGGMGLGLSTSKQLVELMGGVMGVESKLAKGSTFWFTVPFEKRASERLPVEASKQAFPGATILIVDASETSRRVISSYLTSWGMRAKSASTIREAIERMRSEASLGEPFRGVIFDLRVGQDDGLDLARQIRRDPSLREAGLIVMTSLGDAIDDQELRDIGVNAYISKPVEQSELFDALGSMLARDLKPSSGSGRRSESSASEGADIPKESREHVRILLAEDKPLNQKLTLSQLKVLGYRADAVSNGFEVIQAIQKSTYDIILMDCQMPGMDGYEATKEIRRLNTPAKNVKIVAMTAHALEGDREKCLAAGMDDYLSKPTRQEDLAAAIARCFRGSSPRPNATR